MAVTGCEKPAAVPVVAPPPNGQSSRSSSHNRRCVSCGEGRMRCAPRRKTRARCAPRRRRRKSRRCAPRRRRRRRRKSRRCAPRRRRRTVRRRRKRRRCAPRRRRRRASRRKRRSRRRAPRRRKRRAASRSSKRSRTCCRDLKTHDYAHCTKPGCKTCKCKDFVKMPLASKGVDFLPGIGPLYGCELKRKGITKAYQVVFQYLKMNRNQKTFAGWLVKLTKAYPFYAKQCAVAVNRYCKHHCL